MSALWIWSILLMGVAVAAIGLWLARRRRKSMAELHDQLVTVTQCARQAGDNIAHDLRTPLTRLRADVEAALRHEDGTVHRAALERTLGEVEGMQSTINALLTLGQAEAGGIRLKKAELSLSVLLEEMIELYAPSAEERDLTLRGKIENGIMIEADRQLLARIFSNLLDNELKYVPAGGSILLTAGAKSGGLIVVTVEDSGPGIPPEKREKIFERFTRLDPSRTISSGAGLGLSLVRAFARLLQGDVCVAESRLGGAAFIVTLPASAAAVPTPFP